MDVYIANFGQQNYEWPECLRRSSIATMNELSSHEYWVRADKEGYIQNRLVEKTVAGKAVISSVASRWYNLMTIISGSSGDLWVHREKEEVWWTTSEAGPPEFYQRLEPVGRKREVIVCHKPCAPWRSTDQLGRPLYWSGLHAKARDFLSTEGTLQRLSPKNAQYALALIQGADLSAWHNTPDWRARQSENRKAASPVTTFNDRAKAIYRMAGTAFATAKNANGQKVERTLKNKEVRFSTEEALRQYIAELIEGQEELCAVTGLCLQFDGSYTDAELLCSLDRIDSGGHYEEGNLQVVCRFANRWKNDDGNVNFVRLIELVRNSI